jgi:hypothetical protein
MPSNDFHAGDIFYIKASVCNPGDTMLEDIPFWGILDAYNELFFWPGWTSEAQWQISDFEPGVTNIDILSEFTWPDIEGSATGIFFYAAMTNPAMTELLGTYDYKEFGWSE